MEEEKLQGNPDDKKNGFPKLKKENFVVILLIGVLLLVISIPTSDKKEEVKAEEVPKETAIASQSTEDDYVRTLEQTLEKILSVMEGAGEVKVMITLKDSGQLVVEKDYTTEKNQTNSYHTEETVYIEGQGQSVLPYVNRKIYPQIEGVVVCAQGGNYASVNKNITEAIQALFGIEAHKIKIIKMSSK